MINCLVFDLGNVVWRFQPFFDLFFDRAAASVHLTPQQLRQEFVKVYQDFELDRLTLSSWASSLNPSIDPNLFSAYLQDCTRQYFHQFLITDTLDLVDSLRARFTLGCLSNTENFMYSSLSDSGLLSHFDFHILSWQVKARKPDPTIYRSIFDHTASLPSQVLFIDDKPENIVGAQVLGIQTIQFSDFGQFYPKILDMLQLS